MCPAIFWKTIRSQKLFYRVPDDTSQTAEGKGKSSQFAEEKTIQATPDVAEQEKCPVLSMYLLTLGRWKMVMEVATAIEIDQQAV